MVAKHCFLLWIFNPFLLFYADFSHRNNQFIHLCPIEGLQFQELVPGRTGTTRYEVILRWSDQKDPPYAFFFSQVKFRLSFVDSIAVRKTVIILRRRVRN